MRKRKIKFNLCIMVFLRSTFSYFAVDIVSGIQEMSRFEHSFALH